ncbi:hypothetical protein FCV25MIE_25987 [Fagus crenata]
MMTTQTEQSITLTSIMEDVGELNTRLGCLGKSLYHKPVPAAVAPPVPVADDSSEDADNAEDASFSTDAGVAEDVSD